MPSATRGIEHDIAWGVRGGLSIAGLYCLWVSVVRLTSGPRAFENLHVSYTVAVTTYLGIGLVSGAIVGALRRFTGTALGSYAVGLLSGLPLAFGLLTSIDGFPSRWSTFDQYAFPFFGVVAGLVIGSELDKRRKEAQDKSR